MFEEQALFAFVERHGLEGVALRLFGGYGPRQNLTWWGGPQSVFIGAALKGEEMELHGTGRQTRSFTYVDDMVEAFVRAVHVPEADGELLNVGNDREITIEDLARMVWRLVSGDEPRIKRVPLATFGRYEDVDRRVPDNRRAAKVLGHTPSVPLEDGLVPTIAWQREAMARAGLL
jgi:UDP-glucose 4-epimerase